MYFRPYIQARKYPTAAAAMPPNNGAAGVARCAMPVLVDAGRPVTVTVGRVPVPDADPPLEPPEPPEVPVLVVVHWPLN